MKFRVYFLTRWLRNLTKSFSRRNVRRFIAKELCTSSTLVVCTTMMILQALYLTTDTIPKRVVTLRDHNEALTAECMEVHIAVPSNGNYQRQRLPILIKSILLYSRHVILHLHMITDNINKKRIQILLSTWKLPQVVPHYYEADEFLSNPNSLVEMAGYFMRNKHMLPGVNKMILTKSDVYFISDIAVLWYNLEVILLDEMIAVLESHSSSPQKSPSDGVLLLNLEETLQFLSSLKPQCHNAALLFTKDHMSSTDTRALISVICRLTSGRWEKQYDRDVFVMPAIDTEALFPVYVAAVSSRNIDYDVITHIEKFNGDSFRHVTPSCVNPEKQMVIKNLCDVYPMVARLPRRTHISFISNVPENVKYSSTDVTLVTQLMINRIENLERLLESWEGPSQVTLYLTDEELMSFKDFYDQSDILKKAKATYHVIFKRHVFYPINYVRNVAIRETKTPFYVMIDVDFAAQSTLYQSIISHIKQLKANEKKVFIIPVFETPYKSYTLPKTKEQLVKDLDSNLLIPYHQVPGTWTKGHERTDYDKWRKSNNTYEVQWEFGFEPYVVVPTSEFLYDESLVERMRDKLIYTWNIINKGYSLHVLPFDYLIHTPHRKSNSYLHSDDTFLFCSKRIYERGIQELKQHH